MTTIAITESRRMVNGEKLVFRKIRRLAEVSIATMLLI